MDDKQGWIHAIKHPGIIIRLCTRSNIRLFFQQSREYGLKTAIANTRNTISANIPATEQSQSPTPDNNSDLQEDVVFPPSVPHSENPIVSIIIPVYNQIHYTVACLQSIIEHDCNIEKEIIIADDVSSDKTTELDSLVDGLIVIHNKKNLGFTLNCNHAAKRARGKYILFLNNDTVV